MTLKPTEEHRLDDRAAGLRLIVLAGGTPLVFPLPNEGRIVLGRDPASLVFVDDGSVSREHAALHVETGALTIEDLGSRNGTRVRGRALARGERVSLQVNEVFELGAVSIAVQGPVIEPARVLGDAPAASPAMARVYELTDLVAPAPVCVLLLGETGVGKTAAADRIHQRSGRTGPLVKLNCAAVPEALLEGELFGYERGAFTGAQQAKAGLIEASSGGTLLLDEIGDMALATQAKLLHAVEQGEVMRLGALKPRAIDVRIIAATHRDLGKMVSAGTFRADLYYRINGITITIPALRERREDIIAFAERFLAATCARMGRPTPPLTREARDALLAHPWPDNLRELRNVMDRAALLFRDGAVTVDALALAPADDDAPAAEAKPSAAAPRSGAGDIRSEIDSFERERILRALEEANWNQTRAAELVGLPLRTFAKRLAHHGLNRSARRRGDG